MTQRQTKILNMLREQSINNESVDGSKHAAAVVIKNKIVGVGVNSYKSHPFANKYSAREGAIYFHAETSAIYDALRYVSKDELKKATLYVARVNKNGDDAMSKPCSGCSRCIEDFGIRNVVYTTEEGIKTL